MKDRIKKALEEGIVLGVKYGVVLAILAFVARDYTVTRSNALYGKAAQEWIAAGIQAQRLPQSWAPPQAAATPASVAPAASPSPAPVPAATPLK